MKKLVALAAVCSLFPQFNAPNSYATSNRPVESSSPANSNIESQTSNVRIETNDLTLPKPLIVLSELNLRSGYLMALMKGKTPEEVWDIWKDFNQLKTRLDLNYQDDRKFLVWLKVYDFQKEEKSHNLAPKIDQFIEEEATRIKKKKTEISPLVFVDSPLVVLFKLLVEVIKKMAEEHKRA